MAAPLTSGKKTVDLAGGARSVRKAQAGSRIRRDPPPPPEKKVTAAELREREAWAIAVGIMAVALAIAVILLAVGRWGGWSPSQYEIRIEDKR